MFTTEHVIKQYERYVMNTYVRTPVVITKGKGSRVWDLEGHEYLDLFPGWAVSGIGHCHPWVMKAIRGQSTRLLHLPNSYYHPQQAKLAKKIVDASFEGKVFFANSGAEAVETAIKLARKWGQPGRALSSARHSLASVDSAGSVARHEIIVMEQSFHGRTTGALSATGQPKYQQGFEPLLPGFVFVPYGDLESVRKALTPNTSAILVEPIQGEGGVQVPAEGYLRGLRAVAEERRLLLIFDEIQTGMGRTGRMFAFQHSGVVPDVMLLAKMLGGGFPIGAVVARPQVADLLTPGTHAATFGGSPMACACGLAVFEAIEKQQLLERTNHFGALIVKRLKELKTRCPIIQDVRGLGLMIGIELSVEGAPVVEACRRKRVLINCTQGRVLRLLPAMTITRAQVDKAMGILEEVLLAHASKWEHGDTTFPDDC